MIVKIDSNDISNAGQIFGSDICAEDRLAEDFELIEIECPKCGKKLLICPSIISPHYTCSTVYDWYLVTEEEGTYCNAEIELHYMTPMELLTKRLNNERIS